MIIFPGYCRDAFDSWSAYIAYALSFDVTHTIRSSVYCYIMGRCFILCLTHGSDSPGSSLVAGFANILWLYPSELRK